MINKNNNGFTFVELIVVIGILSILSSIGIYNFYGYISDANDAKRITDIQSIKIELDNYRRNNSLLYPTTEGRPGTIQIMSGSEIIAYQYAFDEYLAGELLMKKVPLDPKTNMPYIYSVSKDRTSYQIVATLESQDNLISFNPLIDYVYAWTLVAYVEGNFLSRDKTILPGLLYAVQKGNTELKINENDVNGNPNLAKVILNGQSLNLAYDMKGNVISDGTDLTTLLSSVSLVENKNISTNYLSCSGVINTEKTYSHGEKDIFYMNGTTLNSQIGRKYKTCDGNTGTMKPDGDFYYNCVNIGAGAVFDNTCKWTGCNTGYTEKTDGTIGCKLEALGPVLITPSNGASNVPNYGVLTWQPVSGTNIEYKVYLGLKTETASLVSTQTTTNYIFSSLLYSKEYNWYVESCENSVCKKSLTFSFSTTSDPALLANSLTIVDPPELITPINGAINMSNSGVLTWQPVSGTGIEYKVYLGLETEIGTLASIQTTTDYTFSSLLYGREYNWYVEACKNTFCSKSSIFNFYTTAEPTGGSGILTFLFVEIDTINRTVISHGEEVILTNTEFEVLKKIFIEDGAIVTRETLVQDYGMDEQNINQEMMDLQKKIGDNKEVILKIRAIGYRLNK